MDRRRTEFLLITKAPVGICERWSENRRASYTLNFLRIQAHELFCDTVISKVLVNKLLWYVVETIGARVSVAPYLTPRRFAATERTRACVHQKCSEDPSYPSYLNTRSGKTSEVEEQ